MACTDSSMEIGPLIATEDDSTSSQVVASSRVRINKTVSVILAAAVALIATAGVYKAWQYKVQLEVDNVEDATSLDDESDDEPQPYVVDRAVVAQPNPTPKIFYEAVNVTGVPFYADEDSNGLIASPKSGSNPGIVIIPGKGGTKERQNGWVQLLAGRGIVALTIDISPANANDQTVQMSSALTWMKSNDNPYKKYLKTSDISIMGYSAGGAKMNEYLIDGNSCLKGYKNYISLSGIRVDLKTDYPDSTLIKNAGYLAIQAFNDGDMGFNGVIPFTENVGTKNGGKSYALCYNSGGHQPMQNTNFYQQVADFIHNVNGYEPPYACDTANDNGKGLNNGKAADTVANKKSGTPMPGMEFNLWTSSQGSQCCEGYCLQITTCTAWYLDSSIGGNANNCFLYD